MMPFAVAGNDPSQPPKARPVASKAPDKARAVASKAPEKTRPVASKAPEKTRPVASKAPEEASRLVVDHSKAPITPPKAPKIPKARNPKAKAGSVASPMDEAWWGCQQQ